MDEAKALAVTFLPFEVIHKRPGVIADDVIAFVGALFKLCEVCAEEVDAVGIVDAAICVDPIRGGEAVFANNNWKLIAFVKPLGRPVEYFRGDGPIKERSGGGASVGYFLGAFGACADLCGTEVQIDRIEIERLADRFHIGLVVVRDGIAVTFQAGFGVVSENDGVAPPGIIEGIRFRDAKGHFISGVDVFSLIGGRGIGFASRSPADDWLLLCVGSDRLAAVAMREEDVVRAAERVAQAQLEAGCMQAVCVAKRDKDLRLIKGDPLFDAIAQVFDGDLGVVLKPLYTVRVEPAALVVERKRVIPVKQGNERFNLLFKQFIDEAVVEIHAFGVYFASAIGEDAWPRERETVGLQPDCSHQVDVAGVMFVVITGAIAVISVKNVAAFVGKSVPD